MKLIIDIPEWLYDSISEYPSRGFAVSQLESAILHGTVLTECEDAISREAFIKRYDEWMYSEYGKHCEKDALAIRVANSLPSVTLWDTDSAIKSEGYMRGVNDDRNLWEHRIKQIRDEIERATIEMDYDTAKEALEIIDKYR